MSHLCLWHWNRNKRSIAVWYDGNRERILFTNWWRPGGCCVRTFVQWWWKRLEYGFDDMEKNQTLSIIYCSASESCGKHTDLLFKKPGTGILFGAKYQWRASFAYGTRKRKMTAPGSTPSGYSTFLKPKDSFINYKGPNLGGSIETQKLRLKHWP